MAYEDRRSGFDSFAVVILLVLLLVVLVLVVGGFFFWARKAQMVTMDRALVAEAEARIAQEELNQQLFAEAATQADADTDSQQLPESDESDAIPVTIAMDANGAVLVGGDRVDRDKLKQILESRSSKTFVVEVDKDCRFEDLVAMLSLFDELGLEWPRMLPKR